MQKQIIYILLIFLLFGNSTLAQHQVNYKAELSGQYASKSTLPFWLISNKYGTIPNHNSAVARFKVYADSLPLIKNITFDYGAAFLGSRGGGREFFFDEFYMNAHWKKWKLSVGMQHRDTVYNGLSATNNDMLYSGNARMYPELKLALTDYFAIPYTKGWLWGKGSFSNGIMYDDTRYVNKTNVHHLHLDLRLGKAEGLAITCGFDHYVQWGGTSPRWGNMGGLKNFLAAVFVQNGMVLEDKNGNTSITDSYNKAGNHIGQNTFDLSYNNKDIKAVLGFKNIYEDKSGDYFYLGSVRDWNINLYLEFKQQKAITAFLYEYFQTIDQGGYFIQPEVKVEPVIGFDNYFGNGVYQSGWSSYNRIIGIPLFTPSYDKNGNVRGMKNNAIRAHHFGITGFIGKIKYKTMFTYSDNYGQPYLVHDGKGKQEENYSKAYTFGKPLAQESYLLELQFPKWEKFPFVLATTFALDSGDYLEDNFGFQIKLISTGFLKGKK